MIGALHLLLACALLLLPCASHMVYQVLIDSGSTGSRIYVYRHFTGNPVGSLFEVAHKRVRPALSTFYNDRQGLNDQLQSLIQFAEAHVSSRHRSSTVISLKATAGLRVMPIDQQEWLVRNVRDILSASNFSFSPIETRILTGSEEALFALLATNMAFANVSSDLELKLGAADMGGSSMQVAFALPSRTLSLSSLTKLSWTNLWKLWVNYPEDCTPNYRLLLPGSSDPIEVFARSVPGMGIVEAMQTVTTAIATDWEAKQALALLPDSTPSEQTAWNALLSYCPISGPCQTQYYHPYGDHDSYLQLSQQLEHSPLHHPCLPPGERQPLDGSVDHLPWEGTGDFSTCVQWIRQVLLPKAQTEAKCLKQLRPAILNGVDNFPKVLEILGLRGDRGVSPETIRLAGTEACHQPWKEVMQRFPMYPAFRAQQVCFGAAYLYAITTEVFAIDEKDGVSFVPTDEHHHFTVGWPLGAALYHATNLSFDASLSFPEGLTAAW